MYYEFLTSIGMFRIRPDAEDPEKVLLSMDDLPVATYATPEEAARAVYAQETDFERWDTLREINGPRDLREWKAG